MAVIDLSYGRDIIGFGAIATFFFTGSYAGWSPVGTVGAIVAAPVVGVLARETVKAIGAVSLALETRRTGHDLGMCSVCDETAHFAVEVCPDCGGEMESLERMFDGPDDVAEVEYTLTCPQCQERFSATVSESGEFDQIECPGCGDRSWRWPDGE